MKTSAQTRENRPLRAALTVGLLVMLAVCGWAGGMSGVESVSTSVPVTRTVWQQTQQRETMEETKQRLAEARMEELALLDSVIENTDTNTSTRQSALTQKAEIARRMENEAAAEASLALMDIGRAAVVCSQIVTVFLECPQGETDAQTAARITETVSAQTGCARENVKIIPVGEQ